MKASEFCYWLQGYIEIGHNQMHKQGLNYDQTEIIKKHLSLVFKHELDHLHGTPEHQAELQQLHNAGLDGELFRC